MILSIPLLELGRSVHEGYTRRQLAILGVSWPPQKGWMGRLVGKAIPVEDYALFVKLKGEINPPVSV